MSLLEFEVTNQTFNLYLESLKFVSEDLNVKNIGLCLCLLKGARSCIFCFDKLNDVSRKLAPSFHILNFNTKTFLSRIIDCFSDMS